MHCGYCDGIVTRNHDKLRYEHAYDGGRVADGLPGDYASSAHNRAGTPVNPADVHEEWSVTADALDPGDIIVYDDGDTAEVHDVTINGDEVLLDLGDDDPAQYDSSAVLTIEERS